MGGGEALQVVNTGQFMHIHLLPQCKEPCTSLQRADIAVGLARCHMTHTFSRDKRALKIFPQKVSRKPAQATRALYLLVKKWPRPKPILVQPSED